MPSTDQQRPSTGNTSDWPNRLSSTWLPRILGAGARGASLDPACSRHALPPGQRKDSLRHPAAGPTTANNCPPTSSRSVLHPTFVNFRLFQPASAGDPTRPQHAFFFSRNLSRKSSHMLRPPRQSQNSKPRRIVTSASPGSRSYSIHLPFPSVRCPAKP